METTPVTARKIILITILLLMMIPLFTAPKLSVKVTGKWDLRFDDGDLSGGAGTDFPSVWETAATAIDIDITKTDPGAAGWRLDIRRVDSTWPSSVVSLYARRTNTGSGSGTISGGLTYQEVTTTDAIFFTGTLDRSGINVQLRLENVSVRMGMDDFLSTIYYTVTDTY